MEDNIVYFITGANKGIGLHLTRTLLLRPNTTVISTQRTPNLDTLPTTLSSLTAAPGSKLIIIPLEFCTSDTGVHKNTVSDLVFRLENEGVHHIDTIILNAGAATSFRSVAETDISEVQAHFEINTLWPIQIWQVLRGLLVGGVKGEEVPVQTKKKTQKKMIYISSALGSITSMHDATPSLAYGISKAGANFFVRKVHFEEDRGVVALAVHPGWVKTHNGQFFADSVGVKEPPMSLEDSVDGILRQIDNSTRETTSGSFVSWNGDVIPW
ncbi:hypothetical protein SBOR_10097 [Sclerotinia borealis F-4128]|uniref:Aflatoxin biosynthesis ketoreductase nor-1 n=1 Tax=Sclerotinia borealis (strain F-4128) TaxID=1432307 RepID=W9C4M0_SCLBF|nr:hypothetical protein SBOR_10097 [Sclerotinia borealis F-4128]